MDKYFYILYSYLTRTNRNNFSKSDIIYKSTLGMFGFLQPVFISFLVTISVIIDSNFKGMLDSEVSEIIFAGSIEAIIASILFLRYKGSKVDEVYTKYRNAPSMNSSFTRYLIWIIPVVGSVILFLTASVVAAFY